MVLLPSVWVIILLLVRLLLIALLWRLLLVRLLWLWWLLIVSLLWWLLVLVNDHWLLRDWGPYDEPDDEANYTGEEYDYDPQCSA